MINYICCKMENDALRTTVCIKCWNTWW